MTEQGLVDSNGVPFDDRTGRDLYGISKMLIARNKRNADNIEQLTSEFLARSGIDGVKAPDIRYGKSAKDDKLGNIYVSFRDDNIRVDHKWVDGQQRFSTVQIEKNVDEMLSKLDEAKGKSKEEIFKQYNNEQKIIGALPDDINLPEALKVADPVVKAAQAYMLDHLLNQPGHEFAYDADDAKRVIGLISPRNEMRVVQQRNSSSLAFIGNNPKGGWDCIVIAPRRGEFYVLKTMFGQTKKPYQDKVRVRYSFSSSVRNEAVGSLLQGHLASIRDVDQTAGSISNPAEEVNHPRRSFSTVGSAYPGLNRLSDDRLIAVAVAARTVFGKAGKKQSRFMNINEVQRHIRALHPDWDGSKVGLESQRIFKLVRPIREKLQEDLSRGVSESKIIEHLPERMREVFGSEMTQQAIAGARVGTGKCLKIQARRSDLFSRFLRHASLAGNHREHKDYKAEAQDESIHSLTTNYHLPTSSPPRRRHIQCNIFNGVGPHCSPPWAQVSSEFSREGNFSLPDCHLPTADYTSPSRRRLPYALA